MKKRINTYLSIILIITMSITIVVKAREISTSDNTAPNTTISATIVHPKKLDITLMTDYTGSKKSSLLSSVNNAMSTLYGKNVDAKLYTEDNTNTSHIADTYSPQVWDGSPPNVAGGPSTGRNTSSSTSVDITPYKSTYKRLLHSGFGTFYWNLDNSVSYVWNNNRDYFNMVGEAPALGGVLADAPTNIAQIGASKHALYILTTDNKLYMSGNATQMCGSEANYYITNAASPYTGFRQVMSDVIDMQSNYNGIGILKTDGTVYYAGNVGVQTAYDYYGNPIYGATMNVATTSSSSQYMYAMDQFLVTSGFVQIPGMSNITRIALGNESIIGMNDITGQCYGIGYNLGQFGWTDPYFVQNTGPNSGNQHTIPSELNAKLLPMINSTKIKQLYMYGTYSKIIQTDNTIWNLTGGGFTTDDPFEGLWTGITHELNTIAPGSYTKVGTMASDAIFDIDTAPSTGMGVSSWTVNYTTGGMQGYGWTQTFTKYTFGSGSLSSASAKADGTAIYKYNGSLLTNYFFSGVTPVYSLNTNAVTTQNYRTDSDKILLYVSDTTSTNYFSNFGNYYPMLGLTHSFMTFLSANNFGNYIVTPSTVLDFIDNRFSVQEVSLRQISNSTSDGHLYSQGNYAQAVSDILAKYANNSQPFTKYVVANEDVVQYNTQMNDKENDNKKDERWMFTHDPTAFLNDTGMIDTSGQWVSSPITTFSKTGEYKVTYQAQDDPTGNENFSNYDYWSNQSNQLDMLVHRRPFAKFNAITPREIPGTATWVNGSASDYYNQTVNVNNLTDFDKNNSAGNLSYSSTCIVGNYGVSGSQGVYAPPGGLAGPQSSVTININVPDTAVSPTLEFDTSGGYDLNINGNYSRNNGFGDTFTQLYSHFTYPLNPGGNSITFTTYAISAHSSGPRGDKTYYPEVDSSYGLDNLKVSYSYTGLATNVKYTDTSYDLDHTQSIATNNVLNSLPDKGIQAEEWKWIDVTPNVIGTWQNGRPSTVLKDHYYQVSLRVQDLEGAWSDPYVATIGDNIAVPPVARFTISNNPMTQGSDNAINDTSYDPNGFAITQRSWSVLDTNYNVIKNYGTNRPDLKTLDTGNYIVEEMVENSVNLWSVPCYQNLTVISPLTLAATLSPNPAKKGQTVTFDIKTTGYANNLSIFLPDELKPLDTINTMGYFTKAITPLVSSEDTMTYVVPLNTPSTIDSAGNRLRTPYIFNVRADNAKGNYKIVPVELDVEGNIYDGIKTEMK